MKNMELQSLHQDQNGQEPVKFNKLYYYYGWYNVLFYVETQSSQLAELSLADLEQKALFLPRSAISENLEEIGQGELLTPNMDHHIVINS